VSKIVIDRDVFAALASDTRIKILKQLDERRKTLSEMSRAIGCNKSAIHKHLSKLVENGLIEKEETDHKWIYYSLTGKGRSILHPEKFKITLLLSSAVVSIAGAIISAYMFLEERAPQPLKVLSGENYSKYSADEVASGGAGGGMIYALLFFIAVSIILISAAVFLWRKERNMVMGGVSDK